MLWNQILLAYDNSQQALRAVEYVGQMFGRVDNVKVIIFGVYDKVPEHDMEDTVFTDQVRARISVLEREKEKGRDNLDEAKKLLLRKGFSEDQVKVKYVEKKKGVAKDIIDEVKSGGYGTVVLGRKGVSNLAGMLFGSVSSGVIGNLVGATICVVE
ncbi:MAG: universal stress protein [Desulfarculus sp.]|nr:universal stress protein [Pseudomonadota bacterium]MBV1716988.1 universal stress protein [Desulfarculus sp.]MBU4575869.1 universal stress protein [Pseudomonadota bacterium]MBU4597611.1 universal stress protein [Pseudomonadota bacterium]MBV1736564.1 universal stress protein [Desulfarculus sp.]